MAFSEHDISNAILEIFASRGLVAGDVMWVSRLEQFWVQTQLRRSDLVAGIAQLCTEGLLELEEQGDQVNLSLTDRGEDRARGILLSKIEFTGRHLRQNVFPHLRTRIEAESASGGGRREYE